MKIFAAAATDTGKRRSNNEDAFLVDDELRLYAVADGVGGSEGGEVASRIAVETLRTVLPDLLGQKDRTPPIGIVSGQAPEPAALAAAVTLANRNIHRESGRSPGLAGMGTTLTALLLTNGTAHLAHAGDSRAYLLRAGALQQVTNDHSVVAEQVRAGVLTPEQANASPYRHVITRALGSDEDVRAEVSDLRLREGDIFLLCTDGLTDMVDDARIGSILGKAGPREASKALVDAANEAGGADNITAVVVQVLETGTP